MAEGGAVGASSAGPIVAGSVEVGMGNVAVAGEFAVEATLVEAPLFLEEEALVIVAEDVLAGEAAVMAYAEAEAGVGVALQGTAAESYLYALLSGYGAARNAMDEEALRASAQFLIRLTRAIFGGG